MDDLKLCKDCRYYYNDGLYAVMGGPICLHESVSPTTTISRVSGKKVLLRQTPCTYERNNSYDVAPCGILGLAWEPKPAPWWRRIFNYISGVKKA